MYRVERVEVVSTFRLDASVLLTKGPQVQALAGRLRGKIINVATPPKAPPELPRLVVRIERGVLQVGLNRFQLVVQPPAHVAGDYKESVAFALNLARQAIAELFDKSGPEFLWSGLVVVLNYPASHPEVVSNVDAVRPLFGRLTTLKWSPEDLASFGFRVGRRTGDFYVNYSISGYDMRQVEVKLPAGQSQVAVNLAETEVKESGISVTIDVNSQPSRQKRDPHGDLANVATQHDVAFTNLRADLNLVDIL